MLKDVRKENRKKLQNNFTIKANESNNSVTIINVYYTVNAGHEQPYYSSCKFNEYLEKKNHLFFIHDTRYELEIIFFCFSFSNFCFQRHFYNR